MKPSVVAAIIAGLVLAAMAFRKHRSHVVPILADPNKRYDIDEYIGDERL